LQRYEAASTRGNLIVDLLWIMTILTKSLPKINIHRRTVDEELMAFQWPDGGTLRELSTKPQKLRPQSEQRKREETRK